MKKNSTLGVIVALISAAFFGILPIFTRYIYSSGASTFYVSFLRFFLSLIPLYLYLKLKKADLRINGKELKDILLVTVFGYAGTTMLLFGSYNYIPSGLATTIHFLYPTFTVLGSIIFLKAKANFKKILCVVLSLIGILLFYKGDDGTNMIGMGLAFLSSITYTFYTIYLGQSIIKKMDTLKLIFYMNIVGAIMYLILSIGTNKLTYDISLNAYLVAFLASMGTTFIGVFGYQIAVKNIGSENTAMLSTFEPIISIISGFIIYSEGFTLKEAIGIVLILISTIIIAKNVN